MSLLTSIKQQNALRLRGVDMKLHASMAAAVVLFLLDHLIDPKNPSVEFPLFLVYLISLFVHELGHLAAAACLGVKVREVTLYPFGAVNTYAGRVSPGAEFFLNAAGLIASMTLGLIFLPFTDLAALRRMPVPDSLPAAIVLVNVALVGINLLPLAVLDAGRMLRAVLTLWQLRFARLVLRRVNQLLCLMILGSALAFAHPLLYAAAALVTISCFKEQLKLQTSEAAAGLRVGDALIECEKLIALPHRLTISGALPLIIKSLQSYFPVLHNDKLLGIIERDEFLRQVSASVADDYIVTIAKRAVPSFNVNDELALAIDEMFRSQVHAAVVLDDANRFRGLLVRSRAVEYVLLKDSVNTAGTSEIPDEFPL